MVGLQSVTRRTFATTCAYDIKDKFQAAYDTKLAQMTKVPLKVYVPLISLVNLLI